MPSEDEKFNTECGHWHPGGKSCKPGKYSSNAHLYEDFMISKGNGSCASNGHKWVYLGFDGYECDVCGARII